MAFSFEEPGIELTTSKPALPPELMPPRIVYGLGADSHGVRVGPLAR